MGLNPDNRRVIRATAADEEQRFKEFAQIAEKRNSIVSSAEYVETTKGLDAPQKA